MFQYTMAPCSDFVDHLFINAPHIEYIPHFKAKMTFYKGILFYLVPLLWKFTEQSQLLSSVIGKWGFSVLFKDNSAEHIC